MEGEMFDIIRRAVERTTRRACSGSSPREGVVHRLLVAPVLAGSLVLSGLGLGIAGTVLTAGPASAAEQCPGGEDNRLWEQRRVTAKSIAREAAGEPRLVVEDAKVVVSESPAFEVSLGSVVHYSVYADSVVEVAKNRKFLGEGWGRIAVKTSPSTGCAWALVSDKGLQGSAYFWMDVAPDPRRLTQFGGLKAYGYYGALGRDSYHSPTIPVPSGAAVRACAKFSTDSYVTFCSDWTAMP